MSKRKVTEVGERVQYGRKVVLALKEAIRNRREKKSIGFSNLTQGNRFRAYYEKQVRSISSGNESWGNQWRRTITYMV